MKSPFCSYMVHTTAKNKIREGERERERERERENLSASFFTHSDYKFHLESTRS